MSDLQISLLGIGIAAVLGLVIFNIWQQLRIRRKYGLMFHPQHEDVLSAPIAAKAGEPPVGGRVEHVLTDDDDDGVVLNVSATAATAHVAHATDAAMQFPDEMTDYVAVLSFNGPESAHALLPLWKRRFDFGKTVYACGMNAADGAWEKVIPESLLSYLAFKLSLQLADRAGATSAARLEDFRNLVRGIADKFQAQAQLPDVAAAAERAKALDDFCAGVDQLIGLNIVPTGERPFPGGEVARVAAMHDMALQADGCFHVFDADGQTLFTLGNQDGTPFQHHALGQMWVEGLTLLMDVPRIENPVRRYEEMAVLARRLATDLHAVVVDDNGIVLNEPAVARIRDQIAAIEKTMLSRKIAAGSAQARRLFS